MLTVRRVQRVTRPATMSADTTKYYYASSHCSQEIRVSDSEHTRIATQVGLHIAFGAVLEDLYATIEWFSKCARVNKFTVGLQLLQVVFPHDHVTSPQS
jgi:hypothetical protein